MIGLMFGAAALAVWGAGCEQPTIDCRASRGSFAATFVLQNGSGTCSELTTMVVGLQSYYAKGADGKVDISKSTLAIRPENIVYDSDAVVSYVGDVEAAQEADPKPPNACWTSTPITANEPSGVGSFSSTEPADGICTVNNAVSRFASNEIMPTGDPMDENNICTEAFPAQDITYEWRNIKTFVTAAAPGNRFEADLTYTQDGCTATYKVCGVWPVVGCEKYDWLSDTDPACAVDTDENPAPDTCNCPGQEINTPCAVATGLPEDKLCDGDPDLEPQYGIPYGSGINIDFKAKCDPGSLLCVLPACPIPPE